MVTEYTAGPTSSCHWIDISNPDKAELLQIAQKYNLHEASVHDSLQADHLPKYEILENYIFIILRFYDPDNEHESDTVQELTNKIAVFISKNFIITIHRAEQFPFSKIYKDHTDKNYYKDPYHVLNEIVKAGLLSFDAPGQKLIQDIEHHEEKIFLGHRNLSLLEKLYYLKRKVDVIRRLLILTFDIIDTIDTEEHGNAYTRDTRDLYIRLHNIYDSLSENTHQLLNIYFNISSQRTNEIIRVLTIFSVFFMPLTFIVGIYGMNFDFMPELSKRWGYPAVLLLMVAITAGIFIWFKRKKWL